MVSDIDITMNSTFIDIDSLEQDASMNRDLHNQDKMTRNRNLLDDFFVNNNPETNKKILEIELGGIFPHRKLLKFVNILTLQSLDLYQISQINLNF